MYTTDLLPPELVEDDSLLDSAAQLEQHACILDLEDWLVHRIKHPDREISVNLPFANNGNATGLLVQHCRAHGPCLGPVLLSPDAHLAQLRLLALHFSLQCALFGLPVGGSAGALVCDPRQLSESELRALAAEYLWALRDIIGAHSNILAPAEYAAAWTHRLPEPATLVGKPPVLGGIPDASAAIAGGWLALLTEGLKSRKRALHGCRVALQGFTPAAAAAARLLHEAGARVLALADKSGGLFAECGLDITAVSQHVNDKGILYGFADADPVRNAEVLEADCDVLITAAAERQLNAHNASRIRAPLVLEAVHHAITPAAERILQSRGTTIIPSLLGTAPATLAWFAEWQHGLHFSAPEKGLIESAIRQQIADAFHLAQSAAVQRQTSLPDASRLLALEKLASVLRLAR